MIRIELDDDAVAAGSLLTGTVRWTAEDGRRARRIIIAAQWQTGGAGIIAHGVGRGTIVQPGNAREAQIPFRLLIPHEGPVTFQGKLIAMSWRLCVRVERTGFDEQADVPFRVTARESGAARRSSGPPE